jgi:hypothetical protein
MGMIEFCYRDSFYDLHSELRSLEDALIQFQESDKSLDRLSTLVDQLDKLETAIDGLGLAPDLTIRRQAPRPLDFVRGGQWLSRWRAWMKNKRNQSMDAPLTSTQAFRTRTNEQPDEGLKPDLIKK